jgi:hypothetical protein
MARTILQIYDEIIQEKQSMSVLVDLQPGMDSAQTLLADLTSTSKVAIWRLWAFVTAVVMHTLEVYHDRHKAEVEDILSRAVPGTERWYADRVREWQFGDSLQFVNNLYVYNPVDVSNRLVKRVSVRSAQSQVLVKVAKEDNSGDILPLSNSELVQLGDYLNEIRFAGTQVVLTSQQPESVQMVADVYYDGQLTPADMQSALLAAVQAYIINIPFDGEFTRNGIIDAQQNVPGVKDVAINLLTATAGSQVITVNRSYMSSAGYFTPKSNQGTSLTFNLIPV